jgi:hypothetical protein
MIDAGSACPISDVGGLSALWRESTVAADRPRTFDFVDRMTDVEGPSAVMLDRNASEFPMQRGIVPPTEQITLPEDNPLGRLASVFGQGSWQDSTLWRTQASAVDRSALKALIEEFPHLWLQYKFRFSKDGKIPLPHHEGLHYPNRRELVSTLVVQPAQQRFDIDFSFPCEDLNDRFTTIYDDVTTTLGPVFSKRGFSLILSTKSAEGSKVRNFEFDRASHSSTDTIPFEE